MKNIEHEMSHLLAAAAKQEDDEDDKQDGTQAHDKEREVRHHSLYEKQSLESLCGSVVNLHSLLWENSATPWGNKQSITFNSSDAFIKQRYSYI